MSHSRARPQPRTTHSPFAGWRTPRRLRAVLLLTTTAKASEGPDRPREHSLRPRGRDDRSLWAPRRAVELGEQDLQNIVIERGRQGCTEVDRGGHFAA